MRDALCWGQSSSAAALYASRASMMNKKNRKVGTRRADPYTCPSHIAIKTNINRTASNFNSAIKSHWTLRYNPPYVWVGVCMYGLAGSRAWPTLSGRPSRRAGAKRREQGPSAAGPLDKAASFIIMT